MNDPKNLINTPVLYLVHQLCCISISSSMRMEDKGSSAPPTHASRPQGPSWRGFAEASAIHFLTLLVTIYIKGLFKSDNFFLQFGIYASFLTLFNFLYQKFQSL